MKTITTFMIRSYWVQRVSHIFKTCLKYLNGGLGWTSSSELVSFVLLLKVSVLRPVKLIVVAGKKNFVFEIKYSYCLFWFWFCHRGLWTKNRCRLNPVSFTPEVSAKFSLFYFGRIRVFSTLLWKRTPLRLFLLVFFPKTFNLILKVLLPSSNLPDI